MNANTASAALLGPLAGLTNSQLREKTKSFVEDIRKFQTTFESDERSREDDEFLDRRTKVRDPHEDVEAQRMWIEAQSQGMDRQSAHDANFIKRYRIDAVILKDEMKLRFKGVLPTYPQEDINGRPTTNLGEEIFSGFLAGAHPISFGADLLEFWASQLP